jgi:hypothetical protein
MNVAFFWWYPVGCAVVVAGALAISPRRRATPRREYEGHEGRRTRDAAAYT